MPAENFLTPVRFLRQSLRRKDQRHCGILSGFRSDHVFAACCRRQAPGILLPRSCKLRMYPRVATVLSDTAGRLWCSAAREVGDMWIAFLLNQPFQSRTRRAEVSWNLLGLHPNR